MSVKVMCPHCGKSHDGPSAFCCADCAVDWANEHIDDYYFCPTCRTWSDDPEVSACYECCDEDEEDGS